MFRCRFVAAKPQADWPDRATLCRCFLSQIAALRFERHYPNAVFFIQLDCYRLTRFKRKRAIAFRFGVMRFSIHMPVRAKLHPENMRQVSPCPHDRIFAVAEHRKGKAAAFVPVKLIAIFQMVIAVCGKGYFILPALAKRPYKPDAVNWPEIVPSFFDAVICHFNIPERDNEPLLKLR